MARDHTETSGEIGWVDRVAAGRGAIDCACYSRGKLAPGMTFDGPAIVDQGDATTVVAPGFRARVDHVLDLILERESR